LKSLKGLKRKDSYVAYVFRRVPNSRHTKFGLNRLRGQRVNIEHTYRQTDTHSLLFIRRLSWPTWHFTFFHLARPQKSLPINCVKDDNGTARLIPFYLISMILVVLHPLYTRHRVGWSRCLLVDCGNERCEACRLSLCQFAETVAGRCPASGPFMTSFAACFWGVAPRQEYTHCLCYTGHFRTWVARSVQWLTTARTTGVRSATDEMDSSSTLCVRTGSEAHPASCTMGIRGSFPGVKRGRGVTLTTDPHLVPTTRIIRRYISSTLWRLHGGSGTALHQKI
jgi:hypothetical protein